MQIWMLNGNSGVTPSFCPQPTMQLCHMNKSELSPCLNIQPPQ